MKIKLKLLHIENFKGTKQLDITFGEKTHIDGQNASGKTTVFDAFTWLLFNKNSAGEEKFNVRPLDDAGNRIDNIEIKVVAVLEVDGKEVELSKVQKQNWVKKRGTDSAVLQGNVNSYEIDGYPKTEAEYKAYISELVAEDLFKMLTNPQHFVNMKWKDQRDILMKFVSDVSDVELAQKNPEFADLIIELEKAPSTDDIQKKFSKALSEWKKKQVEIPVRIDELSKSLVEIDVAELELAKNDLVRQIEKIDSKIADSGKEVDKLCSESMELQFEINDMFREEHDKLLHKRRELENSKSAAENDFTDSHNKISAFTKQIAENKSAIEVAEKERTSLGAEYKEAQARVFDETVCFFDESKWKFDENSTVCSLCGQSLPEDRIAEIRVDFESRKAQAKADALKKLEEFRDSFDKQKKADMEDIKTKGFEKKHLIEELTEENTSLETKIEELKKHEIEVMRAKNELEKQIAELPKEPDMSSNAEYQQKKARYHELEKQIANLKETTSVADTYRVERKALEEELDSVKTKIAKVSNNIEIEERIGELEEEQKEVAQKVADQEKMLYLLEQFIKAKMMMISESINSKFNTVSWKLFETQLNGGLKECCECTVNGVPFSALNSGHRIVAGLDIICSLSELYGVNAPIFVDNAESINSFNVPTMDAQMILLSVSEDKELKVEVE